MHILNEHILIHLKIRVCKIPNCLNAAAAKPLCNLNGAVPGECQGRNVNGILFEIRFQIVQGKYLRTLNGSADHLGIDIKKCLHLKAALGKILIICERLSQVAGADDDNIFLLIDAEQLPDFGM